MTIKHMFKALHLKKLQTKRRKFKAIQGQTKPTEHEQFVGSFRHVVV